ncbi:NAD(P)H-quinone oxidoreductase [Brevundimonas sp.]|jgi:putative PIG3 family NAD(P)H quinone oxidoreductase|uniref:NAD(P)H-quinone oxidoreductase n=1 Tax=Brevundimonas sp. TaxID=1871086 RepID=UPI002E11EF79|nr:NAD(P)H-quinone oxidoreductase [Brevundimonas sp.]
MRAVGIEDGTGPAEALRLIEVADPVPAPGEVLIRVAAAGVNRPDLLQRTGLYPPPPGTSPILGLEVAGTVTALGDGVDRWRVGDRVCALLGGGGYADLATVDARHALPVPDDLDLIQAAGLPETVLTVFANVFEAGALKPGETLLIHGATSGIGVTAIQMAKAHGARVIATSRGAAKTDAARALGADVSLDATVGDLAIGIRDAGGTDVILDMVGAAYARLNQGALNAGGRWVVIGTQSGPMAEIDLTRLMLKRQVLTGSTLRSRSADEKARLVAQVQDRIWPWVVEGRVRPPVDATFPLADAKDAHLRLEAGVHVGKILLTLD